jgi:uncharacterized protein (TIGR02271 family)
MTTDQTLRSWIGHDLVDESGDKIGRIDDVYVDNDTGRPEWIAVTTGMFGTRVSFVPLNGLTADENVLVSPWEKSHIKDAPHAEADGELSEKEEDDLYRHYGVAQNTTRDRSAEVDRSSGHDTSGPNTDDAMTRSEEELRVGTESHETGRVRLKKWVETEHQNVSVPVRKEKVRLEREPVDDANVDAAMSGPDLSDEEHEIVLSEEEVVVDKKVVPKERVRLEKDVEVEDRQVSEDVRKERIDVDDEAGVTGRSSRS